MTFKDRSKQNNEIRFFRNLNQNRCDLWPRPSPRLWRRFAASWGSSVCPPPRTTQRRSTRTSRSSTDCSQSSSSPMSLAWCTSRRRKVCDPSGKSCRDNGCYLFLEFEIQQDVICLFSDTLQRAIQKEMISQEMVDLYDPRWGALRLRKSPVWWIIPGFVVRVCKNLHKHPEKWQVTRALLLHNKAHSPRPQVIFHNFPAPQQWLGEFWHLMIE